MVLPVINGKECTSKSSVRQLSDFQFAAIDNFPDNKLYRVWSAVYNGFKKTESKIKQCVSLLNKNKAEPKEIVTAQNEPIKASSTLTDFHLPSIFQENAKKILNEERSLKEMVTSKVDADCMENLGT